MTDFDFDKALHEREEMTVARDQAEGRRKEIDEEMKPHLALRDGRYESPDYTATLVDRETVSYDHDALRKGLLMAGVGMDVITEVYEKAKKATRSTSVLVKRRG